ncbi:MAG: hypothetical protein WCH34_00550 [Bacteroidota bacterium]
MKTKILFYIAFLAFIFGSCTKDIMEPKVTVITPNASAKFSTDVYPVFSTYSCTTCHGTSGGLTLSGTPSTVRTNLLVNAVIPSNSAASLLFIKFNGANNGTHNGKTLTATEVSNIKGWIDSGALDN